jgi:hypothetical protein
MQMKKVSEAKLKRLATAKRNLLAEVQVVKTSSQEVLHTAKAKHKAHTITLIRKVKAATIGKGRNNRGEEGP